jgi:hypothetical protein
VIVAEIVVIQCSASKKKEAGTFLSGNKQVRFVARPGDFRGSRFEIAFRPDDVIPDRAFTWREYLIPNDGSVPTTAPLLQAGDLYDRPIYRQLVDVLGAANVFILSAGWGLVRSDFILPTYDITFSNSRGVDKWKRRKQGDSFHDLAQLTPNDVKPATCINFFGGKDYLPLYYELTRKLDAEKVIHHASDNIPKLVGYRYVKFRANYTNWHYQCAAEFLDSKIRPAA